MDDFRKLREKAEYVETKAAIMGNLENTSMHQNGIFEMANYQPQDSGLAYEIWFDQPGLMLYGDLSPCKP